MCISIICKHRKWRKMWRQEPRQTRVLLKHYAPRLTSLNFPLVPYYFYLLDSLVSLVLPFSFYLVYLLISLKIGIGGLGGTLWVNIWPLQNSTYAKPSNVGDNIFFGSMASFLFISFMLIPLVLYILIWEDISDAKSISQWDEMNITVKFCLTKLLILAKSDRMELHVGTVCFASGKPAKKWTYRGRSY